jgi:hypothetical protein
MREGIKDFSLIHYWESGKVRNDTITALIKYLYKMKDYDPVRFAQYMHSTTEKYYKSNLNCLQSDVTEIFDKIIMNTPKFYSMCDLMYSDYILRIKINSIEIKTMDKSPYMYLYNVCATVLDTLRGKVFQNCVCSNELPKISPTDSNRQNRSNISFTYISSTYMDASYSWKYDESVLEQSGTTIPKYILLKTGQDLIVSLRYGNYKWDYDNDYLELTLDNVMPVIDNQVVDLNKEWSDKPKLDYKYWKQEFLKRVTMLLNGEY